MSEIIKVESLVKDYKDVHAVRDISFSVDEGEFFGFLGVNGAGKSTTINVLCTVLEKTSGTVLIDGLDLDSKKEKIKNLIGIVFQGSVMDIQLSVKDNLISRAAYYGFSSKQTKQRVGELKEMFELDEIMNRRYDRLSGGQKRRVDIARALINRPKILFLDEPTTGLDPKTRTEVWGVIHSLQKQTGLTVFLTTHYMEETAECDNVVILDSGKIAAGGTPHELKNAYARNKLVWYGEQSESIEKFLRDEGAEFDYTAGAYRITLDTTEAAAQLIRKNPLIGDFEVIKGNMDDVFLNITGKRAGD